MFDAKECMICEVYDIKRYFNVKPGAIYAFRKIKDIYDIKKFTEVV